MADTGNEDEPFITAEEAAAFLRLSKRTVYNKVSLGELPHYKRDGMLRFRRSDLAAWMTEHPTEVAEPAEKVG